MNIIPERNANGGQSVQTAGSSDVCAYQNVTVYVIGTERAHEALSLRTSYIRVPHLLNTFIKRLQKIMTGS